MTKPNGALEALTLERTHLAERGEPDPPCAGDARFVSESSDDRLEVVPLCAPCPLRALCAAASRTMRWGVWGGHDKSTPSVTKTNRKVAA